MVWTPAGDPMRGHPDHGGGGRTSRRTYATRTPAKQSLSIDADDLEATVIDMMLTVLDKAKLPSVPSDDTVGQEVAQIEAEIVELSKLRGEGTITMAEWLAQRDPLHARLAVAKKAAGRQTTRSSRVGRLLRKPSAVRKAWPDLDFTTKREIIETIVDKVIVGPATRARWTTIEERLLPDQGYGITWKA